VVKALGGLLAQDVRGLCTGKNILLDGSSQLVHALLAHDLVDELHLLVYPIVLGRGKRLMPDGLHQTFRLKSATPYPSGVVALDYVRQETAR
jgi:dihydrofolate reductase